MVRRGSQVTPNLRDQKPAVILGGGGTFSRSGVWLVSHILDVAGYDLAYLETGYNPQSFQIKLWEVTSTES